MDCNAVKPGMKVRTTKLGETAGMTIVKKHLVVRKEGLVGTVLDYVPGHGGDVWFVKHDNSDDIGAYCFDELEPIPPGHRENVLATAATKPKAELVGEKCSLCGFGHQKPHHNFCNGCGATFITDAMIKAGILCSDQE